MTEAEAAAPSAWFLEHAAALAGAALLGPVVDLACGRGRHALAVAQAGHACIAIDRSRTALSRLGAAAAARGCSPGRALVDLESGHQLPLKSESCGAILVFSFLFRPLARAIEGSLHPGGLLIYETFTTAQRSLGWGPSRADFLLEPQELRAMFPGLETLAYEEGTAREARPRQSARLLARKPLR